VTQFSPADRCCNYTIWQQKHLFPLSTIQNICILNRVAKFREFSKLSMGINGNIWELTEINGNKQGICKIAG